MLTLSPLFSMPSFHALSFDTHSSRVSAITARSSAYRSSYGTPVRNSCDSCSTNMKRRGLRTDPWCTRYCKILWRIQQRSGLPQYAHHSIRILRNNLSDSNNVKIKLGQHTIFSIYGRWILTLYALIVTKSNRASLFFSKLKKKRK